MVELTDDLCKEVVKKADFVTGMDGNLQLCQVTLDDMLQCFAENVRKPVNTLESVIDYYLEHTRDDVQFYDDIICQVVAKIDACIIDYNKIEIKGNLNYFEEKDSVLQQLKVHFKNLKHLQCDQLIQLAKRLLEEQMKPGLKINQFQENLERMEELSPNERNLFWQEIEKQILNRVLIDQLKEVMKRINNISGIYDQCKKRIDDKGMIYGEKNREFLKEISETGYQKLLAALTEYEKRRQSELDMETSPVPGEYIQYIERKIKYGKAEGIQKEIIRFFKREQKYGLTILVRSSVELYREIASDMFMCSIMGLTVWGYMVIAAQTFVFRKESENPLYLRTSMVVQGLIRKEKGNLNGNSIYVDYLTTMLKEKVGKLMNEVEKVCIGNSLKDSLSLELETADFEQILKYLEKLLKTDGFNTTQRWILRVYYQAAHIVHNLCCATSLCSQDTVEKTIWRDLTGKHSFLAKTEKLKEILGKSVGNKLCEGIISILNAPASYFCDRGSLLEEEVKFVLLNYENGCREIMRKEY
ncbi:MAG: Atg14 domain-containing protein [Clostridiales bacterium]|nr:Atg14 domain-containing protein [Clostridiales bacterium]